MARKAGSNGQILIHAVGDIFPRRVEDGEQPESLLAMVHEKIKEADIRFCQLEANLATRGCMQWRDRPTTWYGRVKPDNVRSLVSGGFHVVSHASNHCFDYGPESLLETIEIVRKNGMAIIGVGKDLEEARQPAIIERKGAMVGFLAYNCIVPPEYEARESKPGCSAIKVATYYEQQEYEPGTPPKIITIPRQADVRAMQDAVRNLRAQVDVLIVSVHWGIHHVPGTLAAYQPVLGHKMIDAGADLVIGHHAHILKGIEVYKDKAIFYSLGNFAQETPWHEKPPPGIKPRQMSVQYRKFEQEPGWERYKGPRDKRYTAMLKCIVSDKTIQRISFLPGYINQRAEPQFVTHDDPRFGEIFKFMDPWCKELGTALETDGDEIVVLSRG